MLDISTLDCMAALDFLYYNRYCTFLKPLCYEILHNLGYLLCWRSNNSGVPAVAGFSAFDYVLAVVGVPVVAGIPNKVGFSTVGKFLVVAGFSAFDYVLAVVGVLLLQVSCNKVGCSTVGKFLVVAGFSAVVGIPAVVGIADVVGSLLLLRFLLLLV